MGDAVVGTVVDLSLGLVFACYLLMAKERVLAGALPRGKPQGSNMRPI